MMRDELAEFQVQSTNDRKLVLAPAAGPANEFRAEANTHDIRDDTYEMQNGDGMRVDDYERQTDCREDAEETRDDDIEVTYSLSKQDDDSYNQSVISALGKSHSLDNETNSLTETIEPESQQLKKAVIEITDEALFGTSILEHFEKNGGSSNEDNLSLVSKSLVDESSKNVEEAEAMAEEMKRQLEESLSEFSKSPKPSVDQEVSSGEKGQDLSDSLSSFETPFYSKDQILKLVESIDGSVDGAHSIVSALDAASVSSSSAIHLRRQRSRFGQRRPSTSSWANATNDTPDTVSFRVLQFISSLPLNKQQQQFLQNVVIPSTFLLASVTICRTFFHPWLKVGNDQSDTWALTWTILCILAVVAPVFALEYLLLSGLLSGTAIQETTAKYPEIKRFLKDVRRMRLKAGWWYPAEVRALRKDLEDKLIEQDEDEDSRSVRSSRSTMSREERRKHRSELESEFDSERKEWFNVKEQLLAVASSVKDKNAKLQGELDAEQQKLKQITAQKEQLESNMEVERSQWKFAQASLEEALRAAVSEEDDGANTKNFFKKMEHARDEERNLWQTEREGFQATIQQSEENIVEIQKEHERKLKLLDEMAVSKQVKWDQERKSLQEAVHNMASEAKLVKDALELQICRLMDAKDEVNDTEIRAAKIEFLREKQELKKMLEEAQKEKDVSIQCVANLQSVMMEERTEWESARKILEEEAKSARAECEILNERLKLIETTLEEERESWEVAQEAKTSADTVRKEDDCVTSILRQQLKSKEATIRALQITIHQLEMKADREADEMKADREADISGSESVEAAIAQGAAKGTQDSEVCEERIVKAFNPWLKGAMVLEHIWARAGSPATIAKTVCSGLVVGTSVGLGLFHLRSTKQFKL